MMQDSVILHLILNSGIRDEDAVRKWLVDHGINENGTRIKHIMTMYKANADFENVTADGAVNDLVGQAIHRQTWNVVKAGVPLYTGFLVLNLAAYAAMLQIRQQGLGMNLPREQITRELLRGAATGSLKVRRR
jgi:hypothetical protein